VERKKWGPAFLLFNAKTVPPFETFLILYLPTVAFPKHDKVPAMRNRSILNMLG